MTEPWAPPGEVPAPLPLVVPPMFGNPEIGAVVVPLLNDMVRKAAQELVDHERYVSLQEREEEEMLRQWMEIE